MDIPSKVAHSKYAVAETCISSAKLITVIHVLKFLIMFFVLSSRYRAHVNQMSETDVTEPLRQKRMLQNHCIPHDVYLL